MKATIILLTILFSGALNAQQVLDTLYANEKKNVALFFPRPIRQGITGTPHFVFTYNREKGQYFGLLQARPGDESNLLVVTSDGGVYSYILKYADTLPRLNYFIPEAASIGNEVSVPPKPKQKREKVDSIAKRLEYFKNFSESLLKTKPKKLSSKSKNGIKLQLQNMIYHRSETYLFMEITNTSGITFEVDFLSVYKANGNKKRKASYQKLAIEPIFKHKLPDKVWNGQSFLFVYVLPKFVLGEGEKLMLELQELNGGRKVIVK